MQSSVRPTVDTSNSKEKRPAQTSSKCIAAPFSAPFSRSLVVSSLAQPVAATVASNKFSAIARDRQSGFANAAPHANAKRRLQAQRYRWQTALARFSIRAGEMGSQQLKATGWLLMIALFLAVAALMIMTAWVMPRGPLRLAKQACTIPSRKRGKSKLCTVEAILNLRAHVCAFAAVLVDRRRRRWSKRARWRHRSKLAKSMALLSRQLSSRLIHKLRSSIIVLMMRLVSWQVGYTGLRVGEAALPGPEDALDEQLSIFSVASVNVTSLPVQFEEVASIPCQVVALQETRLNDWAQTELSHWCHERGWQLLCGRAQPAQERSKGNISQWNAKHGGVAVIVRKGLQAALVPATSPAQRRLWDTG